MTKHVITWTLFGLAFVTFPALFFMFVVGGLLPLYAMAGMLLLSPDSGVKILSAIHLAVYLPLFFLVAWLAGKGLCLLPRFLTYLGFAFLCGLLIAVSFLEIYGVGHSAYAGDNAYRVFGRLMR
jgi:uncharacterized membrane protein (DUF441 family)